MGKGDIKTKKGKIWKGSYGKKRLRASAVRRLKRVAKGNALKESKE